MCVGNPEHRGESGDVVVVSSRAFSPQVPDVDHAVSASGAKQLAMFRVPHHTFHSARVPIEGVKRPLRLDARYLRRQIPRNAGQEGVVVVPFDVESAIVVRLEGRPLGFC